MLFRKGLMIFMLTTVQIQIPEAMKPYVTNETADAALQRNALLLYPYILKRKISHGKAAEILERVWKFIPGICTPHFAVYLGQIQVT